MSTGNAISDALALHAIDCPHPLRACLLCRARAEMERRSGEVDAIRFERDDARSRVAMFYSLLQQTLTPLAAAAQQLIGGEGIPIEVAVDAPPRVPDEAFQKIQTHPFEQNPAATQVRVCVCGKWPDHHVHGANPADRRLWEAQERLYRIISAHARYAGRAVVTCGGERASALAVATAFAQAWYGPGWNGDPLAALDMFCLEATGA